MEEQEDYPRRPRSPDPGDTYKDWEQPALRQQPSLRPTVQTSFSNDNSEDHGLITAPYGNPSDIRPITMTEPSSWENPSFPYGSTLEFAPVCQFFRNSDLS
jgi:hypothetical protein